MADWKKIKSRGNVEDRRGQRPAQIVGGIGTLGILLVVAVGLMGGGEEALQVLEVLQSVEQGSNTYEQSDEFAGADAYEVFASTVLGSNNDLWRQSFYTNDRRYEEPRLVLFREATESACGGATSDIGPHYCPADYTIYLDETFFDELQRRFGAQGGDVAEAYVIAHEVGHHIQTLLGISEKVRNLQKKKPHLANQLSVRQELQADCLAGMWAHSIRGADVFDNGEIIEAIDAAAAVGDDRIQEKIQGSIHPESWTHGASQDRVNWFNVGYKHGEFNKCDTFKRRTRPRIRGI